MLSLLNDQLRDISRLVYVAGFSQGGALALALANAPSLLRSLNGALVFSGYEIMTGTAIVPALQAPWLIMVHHLRCATTVTRAKIRHIFVYLVFH